MARARTRIQALPGMLLAFLVATGCASNKVFTPVDVAPSPAREQMSLVVNVAGPLTPTGLEEELALALQQSGIAARVLREDELGSLGTPQPAFHLTFHVKRYDVKPVKRIGTGDPTAAVALYATGIFIVPLLFLGTVRERTQQSLDFTVALRDVSNAELASKPGPSGSTYHYKLDSIEPLVKRDHRVDLAEGRNWVKSELGMDDDMPAHRHEVAAQFAARMTNAALPDILGLLRR